MPVAGTLLLIKWENMNLCHGRENLNKYFVFGSYLIHYPSPFSSLTMSWGCYEKQSLISVIPLFNVFFYFFSIAPTILCLLYTGLINCGCSLGSSFNPDVLHLRFQSSLKFLLWLVSQKLFLCRYHGTFTQVPCSRFLNIKLEHIGSLQSCHW